MCGPTYTQIFFNKYVSLDFTCVDSISGSTVLTICIYWSVPFNIQNLSIQGFWYPLGFLEPIPHGCHGTTVKFWGSQRLYTDFQLHGSSATLTLALFRGQLYLNLFCSVEMTLVNFKLIVKMRFKNVNSCSIRFPTV